MEGEKVIATMRGSGIVGRDRKGKLFSFRGEGGWQEAWLS